ncbi:hypothetical protein M426DRAFT_154632 [Hypoxylon sp. CI-4A]|nr:hypothetical protein M426DRAFT_154632 [Hypoxylon sp. CI-4A]
MAGAQRRSEYQRQKAPTRAMEAKKEARRIVTTDLKFLGRAGVPYDALPEEAKTKLYPREEHPAAQDISWTFPDDKYRELHWGRVWAPDIAVNGSRPMELLQIYVAVINVCGLPSLAQFAEALDDGCKTPGADGLTRHERPGANSERRRRRYVTDAGLVRLEKLLSDRNIPKHLHDTILSVELPRALDYVLAQSDDEQVEHQG